MTKYHDIRESVGEALQSGAKAFERLLVGRSEPNPKSIRDLGKRASEAQLVQSIIQGMQPYQPAPHDVEDTETGYDSEGNYHHPSLRTEHVDGTL